MLRSGRLLGLEPAKLFSAITRPGTKLCKLSNTFFVPMESNWSFCTVVWEPVKLTFDLFTKPVTTTSLSEVLSAARGIVVSLPGNKKSVCVTWPIYVTVTSSRFFFVIISKLPLWSVKYTPLPPLSLMVAPTRGSPLPSMTRPLMTFPVWSFCCAVCAMGIGGKACAALAVKLTPASRVLSGINTNLIMLKLDEWYKICFCYFAEWCLTRCPVFPKQEGKRLWLVMSCIVIFGVTHWKYLPQRHSLRGTSRSNVAILKTAFAGKSPPT